MSRSGKEMEKSAARFARTGGSGAGRSGVARARRRNDSLVRLARGALLVIFLPRKDGGDGLASRLALRGDRIELFDDVHEFARRIRGDTDARSSPGRRWGR